jgi:hypothetical protein
MFRALCVCVCVCVCSDHSHAIVYITHKAKVCEWLMKQSNVTVQYHLFCIQDSNTLNMIAVNSF